MNGPQTIALLLAMYGMVFVEARFQAFRNWWGAQFDFLPALMVYAGLEGEPWQICLAGAVGGLLYDAFSANPLGISILPMTAVGMALRAKRDVVLRRSPFAQFVLGLAASALVPIFTLFALAADRARPGIGWGSLWQWLVVTLTGGAFTPVVFWSFRKFSRAFEHAPLPESSFRLDREIKRGRH